MEPPGASDGVPGTLVPMAETIASPPSLPDFPRDRGDRKPLALTAAARRSGLGVRPAEASDIPFLRSLFHDLRRPELIAAAWPAALQTAFCDDQFARQHSSLVSRFPHGDFFVVEHDHQPAGRLYLDRSAGAFHLIEFALTPRVRNRNFGGRLIESLQLAARRSRAEGVTLLVEPHNIAARRFYHRHGFLQFGQEGSHLALRWQPPGRPARG